MHSRIYCPHWRSSFTETRLNKLKEKKNRHERNKKTKTKIGTNQKIKEISIK